MNDYWNGLLILTYLLSGTLGIATLMAWLLRRFK